MPPATIALITAVMIAIAFLARYAAKRRSAGWTVVAIALAVLAFWKIVFQVSPL